MLPFLVFHELLLLGMAQDNGDPEKEEIYRRNIFKLTARCRNISSHSYRLFLSHSFPGLIKHQLIKEKQTNKNSGLTYSEKANFVSAKSVMTSSQLQQPLIPNASSTLAGKVMLPAMPLETVLLLADRQIY